MKEIDFKTKTARRIYKDYMRRVDSQCKYLSSPEKDEILMEINSHIFEGLRNIKEGDETENLLDLLDKLGSPEEFMKPLVADKKIRKALSTFNPKYVFQALSLNIKNGFLYLIMSFLYLFEVVFLFLIITKIIFPSRTGLFILDDSFKAYGFISNTDHWTEILGFWFIPLNILLAVVFYFLITLLFKLFKR